ncbi:multicopper oxidase family protein [Streptomyces sp. NBC_01373]|uniref:multicopper oxidase family protein n=1 Tax=Streptomyces sp. NBC_01373 TaxID=2903843 RepID=UPI0022566A1D|nr:multicopper oxidase family protein [Streptomyces sp. NBC_01373]MCX4701289.1 multicopper oxidase family protein [Streptomyces sp. NBC_01373]
MNSINRRSVLLAGLGVAGTGALAACSSSGSSSDSDSGSGSGGNALVSPSGAAVAAAEKKRTGTGRQQRLTLTAAPAVIDLGGGVTPRTWAFDGRTPGKEVRLSVGDTLVAELSNQLPDRTATSIHWHGIALRDDMDGVPPTTQTAVRAGSTFTYRFIADAPGTYFFHPHVGVQLDRGLYAPLIVEDPKETLDHDDEWVVLLDDWVDGVTGTPDEVFAELKQGMGGMDMGGMDMGGMDMGEAKFMLMGAESDLLGGDAGDVKYPYHLVNGRVATDPDVYTGKPGTKVRLRIVNAGGDTAYRVALGGHRLTVTHTDGFPVRHREVDALLVGMGERYDVLVTLGDGVFPLVALAEGKDANGLALVRTGSGSAPKATVRPKELDGMMMTASQLRAADDVRLESAKTDVTHRIELTGGMDKYNWAINGTPFDMNDTEANPILIEEGQRVRLDFVNDTDMWHPMHLHGHTYQLGASGPRKDTSIVLPRKKLSVFFDADNPGQWMLHCHNAYHGEAGMMANVAYRA